MNPGSVTRAGSLSLAARHPRAVTPSGVTGASARYSRTSLGPGLLVSKATQKPMLSGSPSADSRDGAVPRSHLCSVTCSCVFSGNRRLI